MREIKFRGKSTTYKEWKYGTPVDLGLRNGYRWRHLALDTVYITLQCL